MTRTIVHKPPRGYTYDPCPGCERTPAAPRPRKGVCTECREALKFHARQVRDATPEQMEYRLYRVVSQSHWMPYIHHDHGDREIQSAYWKALQAFTHRPDLPMSLKPMMVRPPGFDWDVPVAIPRKNLQDDSSGSGKENRPMTPTQAEAMDALYVAIRAGLEIAYAEGVDHGRNLLIQLNDGSMTTADFERHVKDAIGSEQ